MSEAELQRECRDFYGLLVDAVSGGSRQVNDEAYDEVRAFLNELSRSRARLGFSPTETAISVYALKQALFERMEEADGDGFAEAIAFSLLLDALGLWTFE